MRSRATTVLFALLLLGACRESDQVLTPGENARVEVTSDPEGGQIWLDGRNTGKVTPDLLRDIIGQHEILVRLERDGILYGFRHPQLEVKGDSLHKVFGALTMRCVSETCALQSHRYYNVGTLRPSTNPNGALFYYNATEKGLYWPTGTVDGYASIGTPLVAMVAGTRDTLSLGIYDVGYMAGRPAPESVNSADRFTLRQSFWVLPPAEIIFNLVPTVRGIEVAEELIGVNGTNDVAFVRLTFRNITNRPGYQAMDPIVPSAGVTYNWMYVGFALDADVGTASDDMVTYDPTLDMVYTYDYDLQDSNLSTPSSPGIVGLKLLDAPPGASIRTLNAWPAGYDWTAGDNTERAGWYLLSGTRLPTGLSQQDQPGPHIGYVPTGPADYRMAVAAGPLTLAPGEAATMTVAVILASPVPGSFTSGQAVTPGNPGNSGRPIEQIAAGLINKAKALTSPN